MTMQENNQCPECGLGVLKETVRPYVQHYRHQLFTIPHASCYQCDFCNYTVHHQIVLEMMDAMIGRMAAKIAEAYTDSPNDEHSSTANRMSPL